MADTTRTKVSTESYKGVRDFYPEEEFIQKHIFNGMRQAVESFGYVEYNASVLEPAELYKAKSSEEIVNEQTYTFVDRGEREVTLRPEMTPTVARMVAARTHELAFPLRWYSIPNLFRYEKPQRGRLREHWQLNVDLFGAQGVEADAEVIIVAATVLTKLGATTSDFTIKINNRLLMNELYARFSLDDEQKKKISRIIDKKEKLAPDVFITALEEIFAGQTQAKNTATNTATHTETAAEFARLLSTNHILLETLAGSKPARDIMTLIESLAAAGFPNVQFVPTITRGFDYYTGMVFEIFDTDPVNPRSIAGGGRYDELLDVFGSRTIPTAGFGMGDVVLADFLAVRNLLPAYTPSAELYIAIFPGGSSSEYMKAAYTLADTLRKAGLNVAVDLSGKKIGDQIKIADKQKIPFILVVGENEITSNMYTVKELATGTEKKVSAEQIAAEIKKENTEN